MTDCAGPSFTVVIPTYERPASLARCLTALSRASMPRSRFEVIVIDDTGRGALERLIADFEEIDLTILRQDERGPAAARNAGVAAARGTFVAFTDDDCEPSPDWLHSLERHLEGDPTLVIGGRTYNAVVDDPFAEASHLLVEFVSARPDRTGARFFPSNNLAMARSTFESVGGFDVAYRRAAGEDRDLCDRLHRAGHRLRYAPRAVVAHHHSLGLVGFVRQHFDYGRGAHRFRSGRARSRAGRLQLEGISFYARLLAAPVGRVTPWRAGPLMALMALSQASVFAGFSWQAAGSRLGGRGDRAHGSGS